MSRLTCLDNQIPLLPPNYQMTLLSPQIKSLTNKDQSSRNKGLGSLSHPSPVSSAPCSHPPSLPHIVSDLHHLSAAVGLFVIFYRLWEGALLLCRSARAVFAHGFPPLSWPPALLHIEANNYCWIDFQIPMLVSLPSLPTHPPSPLFPLCSKERRRGESGD